MSNRKCWKTAEGFKIPIKDLKDGHLSSILNMLENMRAQNLQEMHATNGIVTTEIASEDLDRLIDRAESEGPSFSFPIYQDLKEEQERRKINLKRC